ncbi:MAG TPA: DNA polymerase [Kofleriaceae bacterium]|nr:DNA polymerase [Kofleriaceae bacterium]
MDRTLVISASNVLAAGFLVVPTDRKSSSGDPVNGLFAVARAIHRVLQFKVPARAVAVIGSNLPTTNWPALLQAQLPALRVMLREIGLHVVEAADEQQVVASYVQAARDAGDDAIVVGRDKRFAQLVTDHVWWYDSNKDVRYTPEIVQKRFTVPPATVAEWLALVGDQDALPGVKGIGAKGATTIIETYGSVEAAVAQLETIEGRIGKILRGGLDEIPRELARARLDRNRPLPRPLAELTYVAPTANALNAVYERLGFSELLSVGDVEIRAEVCETAPELRPAIVKLPSIAALHPLIEDDGTLTGISIGNGAGDAWYVRTASDAWPELARWLADPNAKKVGHDLLAARVALCRMNVDIAGVVADSACASHLSQPSNWAPHELGIVAKHVLGRALPEDDQVRGVGKARKAWAGLPPEQAARIAGQRGETALEIWNKLEKTIDRERLAEYLALTETCVRMELRGVIVDLAALDRAQEAFAQIEAELTAKIEALAGHSFNINSSQQLGTVLHEELKLPIGGHTKTGWSTSIESLEKIENAHPIVPLVIRWRLLRRLRDFWLIALRKTIAADGRVHSRSDPARSFSGHLVNSNPDLSRVPGRTPEMQMIRRAFVAPPGCLLMSVDFNQLGLHVLAHLTKDPALVEPLRARADMHRLTAMAVFEKPADQITDDERQLGKVINFATFAGQGPSALALQLGVSAAEAKEYIARFDRHYALVRAFQDEQLRLAKERGYIETIAGRHWPIGGLESLDSHDRSYAERLARRATHEGSVADVARRALLDADRALRAAGLHATPLVQVVDEVLFEVRESELVQSATIAADAMRHAFELEVPLTVGAWAGHNWADLEEVPL